MNEKRAVVLTVPSNPCVKEDGGIKNGSSTQQNVIAQLPNSFGSEMGFQLLMQVYTDTLVAILLGTSARTRRDQQIRDNNVSECQLE